MNLKVLEIIEEIGIKGSDLNSRERGKDIRDKVLNKTRNAKFDVIILDFEGITSFNSSVADELIVQVTKLAQQNKTGFMYVVYKNVPKDSLYDLELVTGHRKIPCLLLDDNDLKVVCGGRNQGIENSALDTFLAVKKMGTATAAQIARLFDLTINAASTRLNNLYKLRLLRREEMITKQGRHYVYKMVLE